MTEDIINDDLDSIYDFISTGHRREGCSYEDIENYFEYLIKIAYKYKIYNNEILNFIEDIKKELIDKSFDSSFFILNINKIYEKKLKKLIMTNINKFDELIIKNSKQISQKN